ncbi:BTB/POZ and MATH domain-containing protein 1-like [Aegilops tauschii subsp. strangulata]|uniref:BTB/POZ and MATH domain-containing protein 1-like n=1 Tax=Aegilops tauschii subsp. strangulata TaxID=200361 RepID=UPI003CC8668D
MEGFLVDAVDMSYTLKIAGYSRTKALLETGKWATSTPFRIGGHVWTVRYCPNDDADFMSIYLVLDSEGANKDVKVRRKFSVLDKAGVPVPSLSRAYKSVQTFRPKASTSGYSNNMCRDLGGLLESMDGADVTFHVGGQKFSAHRSVLAARSSVFKAELFGSMMENGGDPVEIGDMESDVFKSLLHFIYTDDSPPEMTREDVVMAGHLLVAADRYDVERLKLICEDKLCTHIDSDNMATSLALAEQHSCPGLKEDCFEFLASPSNF